MTRTTLVTGATAQAREAAIATLLDAGIDTALILEGLPAGNPLIAEAPRLRISRIAPGCLCCTGNLTMRVTLNRLLRQPPQRLFVSLATSNHLDHLRGFLTQAPYDALLELTQDLHA